MTPCPLTHGSTKPICVPSKNQIAPNGSTSTQTISRDANARRRQNDLLRNHPNFHLLGTLRRSHVCRLPKPSVASPCPKSVGGFPMSSHFHECPICQKSILDAANLHYHMKFCSRKIKIRRINSRDVGIEGYSPHPHIRFLMVKGRDNSIRGPYRNTILFPKGLFLWRAVA